MQRERALLLATLAAVPLLTSVFVSIEWARLKLVEAAITPIDGAALFTTDAFPDAAHLHPPLAVIARLRNTGAEALTASIAVDGGPICQRSISGGSTRTLNCAVTAWNDAEGHDVAIAAGLGSGSESRSGTWVLEYLELATQHGYTNGVHSMVILPSSSERIERVAIGWVPVAWAVLLAVFLIPPASLPTPLRVASIVVAGSAALELALSVMSPWISNYRIVLSAGTYVTWMLLLTAPRLWNGVYAVVHAGAAATGRSTATGQSAERGTAFFVVALAFVAWLNVQPAPREVQINPDQADPVDARAVREALRAELKPVVLSNCTLRRFGGPNDGGYLMCDNLTDGAQSGYSYGVNGEDNWGCDLSRKTGVAIHQYDCFNTREPVCPGGRFVFHPDCIGATKEIVGRRPFDTLMNQIAANGDSGKPLIVKMDVEGAEYESLLATPDAVLARIDQLPMEFHGTDDPRFVSAVRKLKRTFHLVHVHFNNMACKPEAAPLPAWAFQVLWVNKRLGVVDLAVPPPSLPLSIDARDNPDWPDCQEMVR